MAQVIIEYVEYQELLKNQKGKVDIKTKASAYEDVMSLSIKQTLDIDKESLIKFLNENGLSPLKVDYINIRDFR